MGRKKLPFNKEFRTGRHCVFLIHCHLVFVTKYRNKVFNSFHLEYIEKIMRKTCEDFDAQLIEFHGEQDHIHLLINYPPKVAISKLVNSLKGVSSRMLRRYYTDITNRYWKGVLWSPSYFAGSCGGASIDTIKKYIDSQNRPD